MHGVVEGHEPCRLHRPARWKLLVDRGAGARSAWQPARQRRMRLATAAGLRLRRWLVHARSGRLRRSARRAARSARAGRGPFGDGGRPVPWERRPSRSGSRSTRSFGAGGPPGPAPVPAWSRTRSCAGSGAGTRCTLGRRRSAGPGDGDAPGVPAIPVPVLFPVLARPCPWSRPASAAGVPPGALGAPGAPAGAADPLQDLAAGWSGCRIRYRMLRGAVLAARCGMEMRRRAAPTPLQEPSTPQRPVPPEGGTVACSSCYPLFATRRDYGCGPTTTAASVRLTEILGTSVRYPSGVLISTFTTRLPYSGLFGSGVVVSRKLNCSAPCSGSISRRTRSSRHQQLRARIPVRHW